MARNAKSAMLDTSRLRLLITAVSNTLRGIWDSHESALPEVRRQLPRAITIDETISVLQIQTHQRMNTQKRTREHSGLPVSPE